MHRDATAASAGDATDVASLVRALVADAELGSIVEPHLDTVLQSLEPDLPAAEDVAAVRRVLAVDVGWLLAAHEDDVAVASRRRARLLAAAGDAEAAIDALLEAAELACAMELHEVAGGDVDMAVAMLGGDEDATVVARLARLAGELAHDRAGECWQRAADAFEAAGDGDRAAHALHQAWWASSEAGSVDLLRRAESIAGDRGWGARCAFVLAFLEDRIDDATRHARQALADARTARDRQLEALALHAVACSTSVSGDLGAAITTQRQALAVAQAVGDRRTIDSGGINLVAMLDDDLRIDEALDAVEVLAAQRQVSGTPGQRAEAAMLRASLLHTRGEVDAAKQALDAVDDAGCEPLAVAHGALFRLAIESDLGQDDAAFDEAASALRRAALALGFGSLSTRVAFVEATRTTDAGDDAAACRLLLDLDVDGNDLLGAETAIRITRAALGARDAAALEHAAQLLEACSCTARIVGIARRELEAARALLAGDGADAAEVVADEWVRRSRPIDAARLLVAAAVASERRTDRRRLARAARQAAQGSGARRLLQRIDQLAAGDGTGEAPRSELPALADAALFEGVDAAVRDELLAASIEVRRSAGAVLHEAHDELEVLWLLRSGSVRLCAATDDDRRLTVELLDAGATIGEHALLGQSSAGTIAECEDDVVLAAVSVARVRAAILRCPRLGENLLALAGARLARSRQLAERVAFWSVDRRLARCLLDLDGRYGRPTLDGHRMLERTFTHFQLAELVNARRETVGEFLKRMRAAGVLEQRRRRIVLLDADALHAIVDNRA